MVGAPAMALDKNPLWKEKNMATATKIKKKAVSDRIAQSENEAAEMIKQLGIAQRNLLRVQADMNDQLAEIKQTFEEKAEPLRGQVEELQSGVQGFCEANRDTLTNSGKIKSFNFTTGQVNWRLRPPSVKISNSAAVINFCESNGLRKFLREKIEVNKEAMLDEPESASGIKGVTIKSAGEDFTIDPFEADLEGAE